MTAVAMANAGVSTKTFQDHRAPDGTGQSAPHPPLLDYHPAAQDRDGFVRDLFNQTAGSYDRINSAFSLGSGAWYRRRALQRAGLRPGAKLLDVAVGTGLVAREAVRVTGRPGDVIGLDLSEGMLAEARRSLAIPLIQARAEALPLGDASVDFVSMGYALRHVADLSIAFAEYHRVLRPGGNLLLLEIGRPDSRLAYAVARFYLGWVVPALSRWAGAGSRAVTLMRYYWDTIDACVSPAVIQRSLTQAGFVQVACETQLGIFRAYRAQRPPRGDGAGSSASAGPGLAPRSRASA
jgi:demethylmenaquinone methyltransferase / 2-methoxy-6-polyprenyl-1,4-benzoquinol methylase